MDKRLQMCSAGLEWRRWQSYLYFWRFSNCPWVKKGHLLQFKIMVVDHVKLKLVEPHHHLNVLQVRTKFWLSLLRTCSGITENLLRTRVANWDLNIWGSSVSASKFEVFWGWGRHFKYFKDFWGWGLNNKFEVFDKLASKNLNVGGEVRLRSIVLRFFKDSLKFLEKYSLRGNS